MFCIQEESTGKLDQMFEYENRHTKYKRMKHNIQLVDSDNILLSTLVSLLNVISVRSDKFNCPFCFIYFKPLK